MFSETLLDSSPLRAPVLAPRHHAMALATGFAGFLLALRVLPLFLMPIRALMLTAQSAVVAVVLMLYTLMLCYVHADARRLGLRAWVWTVFALLLSFLGFVLYLTYSAVRTRDWRRVTMPVAYMLEVALVGVLVLVPLIYKQALPRAALNEIIRVPPAPRAAPPVQRNTPIRPIRRITEKELLTTPVRIPKIVAVIREDADVVREESGPGLIGFVPGSVPGGMGVIPYDIIGVGQPPPPPLTKDAARPKQMRVRVGGQVEAAKLIFQVKPEYPPLAKMARIQGTVRLEAVISTGGTIQNLRVLAGHPLLVKAAIDAVARWRYQPTLLNGEPVEVVTEIDANFTLE